MIIYFFTLAGTKNAKITVPINMRKERLILQISSFGYNPYISLFNQTLIKIQHAPSREHSSFDVPIKSASKNSQFNSGGIFWIKTKIINKDNTALNQLEFIFLFKLSNFLFPEKLRFGISYFQFSILRHKRFRQFLKETI